MKIYNTITRKKEELRIDEVVRIYVCGITAYDYSHIGHARCVVVFDTLRRYLEWKGHTVRYVQNFTDVDDKIINKAIIENKSFKEVADFFISAYKSDVKKLNVKDSINPRVTENIGEIIEAILELIKKGFAYVVDGDVYFHVPALKSYGKLSGMSLEELNRHRIEPNPRKKDVKDFALWKSAKDEDFKAKAVFDSPWGKGRPGWHIECSVMALKYLGIPFDIHGGGKDLIFPHHENERAQSMALSGQEPVRYWVHNDFVRIKGEKMSKSLGNIVKIRDVLKKYSGEVLRYFLLSAHYRTALDYSEEIMEKCNRAYEYLRNTLEGMDMEIAAYESGYFRKSHIGDNGCGERRNKYAGNINNAVTKLETEFVNAMEDDLNTPLAFASLHNFANLVNKYIKKGEFEISELKIAFLKFKEFCRILGLMEDYRRIPILSEDMVRLIKERENYRKNKEFDKADKIRDIFKKKGFQLIDTHRGTRWKMAF